MSHPDPFAPDHLAARLRAAGSVYAEDEAAVLVTAAHDPDELETMTARRVSGVPLEHVVGWAEFAGVRVAVRPGVFVPRLRSELLVRESLRVAAALPRPVIVDLCCGSGAIGAALLAARPDAELHATDLDPVAVDCARTNLPGAAVHLGDLFDALPATLHSRIDVLVANVPYVPSDAIAFLPPEARLHEPRAALDGGSDGLDLARRVAADAPTWLAPRGALLIETSRRQAASAVSAFAAAGLDARATRCDDLDATVVIGVRPAPG